MVHTYFEIRLHLDREVLLQKMFLVSYRKTCNPAARM